VNTKTKALLFRLYDIVSWPLTFVSVLQLWIVRRYGIPHFPWAHRELLRRGVFPIRRHFYDPQFHPGDLPESFAQERSLPGIDLKPEAQLDFLGSFVWQEEVKRFSNRETPVLEDGRCYDPDNVGFVAGDIDFYYQIIRLLKPRRIIEIGSGHSTIVALSALEQCKREDAGYEFELSAVEPYPWFRHPKLRLLEKMVEDVDMEEFSRLEAGDILFIDSSHMLRPGGDVEHEILRILPILKAGVYVHVHDIFTPFHYPEDWVKTYHFFWNEQYVLEALLSGGRDFEICGALHYLSRKYPDRAKAAMPLLALRDRHPQSFWMKKVR